MGIDLCAKYRKGCFTLFRSTDGQVKMLLFGVAIGVLIGALSSLVFLQQRASWLSQYEFELAPPPVPLSILRKVREAEKRSYAEVALWRRAVEEAQDILAFASPGLAYRMNFSLGNYRVKSQTIRKILPWAVRNGYLKLEGKPDHRARHALAYFSEQPALNTWQAAALLAWLREDHPKLKALTWAEIAGNSELVAKLYSGYMGAGGAWDLWRSDLTPGPEARRRMGLSG